MAQNSVNEKPYSVRYDQHYHVALMNWRKERLGLSLQEVARRTGEPFQTVRQVFRGKATNRKVYPIAVFLSLDWAQVHNLELEESDFHLAVTNGNGTTHSAG